MNTGQDGFFGSLAGVCGRRLHAVYTGQEPLHPVFGPGEDRNEDIAGLTSDAVMMLHPVFGPGEDRNRSGGWTELVGGLAAPGLRTG